MFTIRSAQPADAAPLSAIYNHFVLQSEATFEEEPVTEGDMRQRIDDVQKRFFWIVCEDGVDLLGYAHAGKWKARSAYRHAVELSVYVDPAHAGMGIGKALYGALLARLRETDVHTVVGGVAGNNPASVALHRSFGFEEIGRLREIGCKFGRWIDVTYFQLLL